MKMKKVMCLFAAALCACALWAAECTVDGVTYEYTLNGEKATLDRIDPGTKTAIVVPETLDGHTVTVIGFKNQPATDSVVSITFPGSVTEVGEGAFGISVDKQSTIKFEKLETVEFKSTGADDTRALKLWYSTFENSTSLTTVEFPENLGHLNAVDRDPDNPLTDTLPPTMFLGCTSLTSVTLPKTLKVIGVSAFNGCSALEQLSLPDGITTLEQRAFQDCVSLALTKLPSGLNKIGNYAFLGCAALAVSEIPASVTSIGRSAFSGCAALTVSEIPASVETIGRSAFSGCTGLKSLVIPQKVREINPWTFSSCNNLKTLEVWTGTTFDGKSGLGHDLDTLYLNMPPESTLSELPTNLPAKKTVVKNSNKVMGANGLLYEVSYETVDHRPVEVNPSSPEAVEVRERLTPEKVGESVSGVTGVVTVTVTGLDRDNLVNAPMLFDGVLSFPADFKSDKPTLEAKCVLGISKMTWQNDTVEFSVSLSGVPGKSVTLLPDVKLQLLKDGDTAYPLATADTVGSDGTVVFTVNQADFMAPAGGKTTRFTVRAVKVTP